jgi:hypothetical protein
MIRSIDARKGTYDYIGALYGLVFNDFEKIRVLYFIDDILLLMLKQVQAKPTETWCLFLSLFAIFLREDGVSAFPQVLLI